MGIPHCVLKSEAYRHLSAMERAVLNEIVLRFNGYNNGSISVSYKEFARRFRRKNERPFGPAISTLVAHGLIDIMLEGSRLHGRAREYRLTFVSTTDGAGRFVPATNEYLRWEPGEKSDATTVVARMGAITTAPVAERPEAATGVVVPFTRNREIRER